MVVCAVILAQSWEGRGGQWHRDRRIPGNAWLGSLAELVNSSNVIERFCLKT